MAGGRDSKWGLAAPTQLAVSPTKVLDVKLMDAVHDTGRRGMTAPARTALNLLRNNIRYRTGVRAAHKSSLARRLDTVR